MHHWKPCHQLSNLCPIIFYFSCIYLFFELNDPDIEKHYKWTLKRLKVGMVSSFHPHSMCKKVERVTAKNWMHFVYKLDNLFRSIKVSDENSSVRPAIQNFNNLLQLRTFFASSMQHSKPHHQLSTLSDIICYFSCIYWFVLS